MEPLGGGITSKTRQHSHYDRSSFATRITGGTLLKTNFSLRGPGQLAVIRLHCSPYRIWYGMVVVGPSSMLRRFSLAEVRQMKINLSGQYYVLSAAAKKPFITQ